jgi:hypothetical protein
MMSFALAPTKLGKRGFSRTARARNRRFRPLSALRAHTKPPYKTDLIWETLKALKRPGRARTDAVEGLLVGRGLVVERWDAHLSWDVGTRHY